LPIFPRQALISTLFFSHIRTLLKKAGQLFFVESRKIKKYKTNINHEKIDRDFGDHPTPYGMWPKPKHQR
jgi:hypothetical protein